MRSAYVDSHVASDILNADLKKRREGKNQDEAQIGKVAASPSQRARLRERL